MSEQEYRITWSRSEPGSEARITRYVSKSELWVTFSEIVNDESNTLMWVELVTL